MREIILNNYISVNSLVMNNLSRSLKVDFILWFEIVFFLLFLFLFFYFLFLEQLGLGLEVIGHNIDHKTWEKEVEDFRTNDIIQHGYYMLTSCTTHGCLG